MLPEAAWYALACLVRAMLIVDLVVIVEQLGRDDVLRARGVDRLLVATARARRDVGVVFEYGAPLVRLECGISIHLNYTV